MIDDPEPSNQDSFRDEDAKKLKQFVFRYLRRNYKTEIADQFANKSQLNPELHSQEFQGEEDEDDYVGAELLGRYLSSKSKKIINEYNIVHKWVTSSLQLYRRELVQILFPLFVFSYLDIVMSHHHKEFGQHFFSAYEEYHVKKFPQAVLQLKSVTSPALMEYSKYVRMLVHPSRPFLFFIKLSTGSLELFVHFINDQKLSSIRKIADERINFETYKGQPRPFTENSHSLILFQSRLTNIPKTNSTKIDWENPMFNPLAISQNPGEDMMMFGSASNSINRAKMMKHKRGQHLPNFCIYTIFGCSKKPPTSAILKLMGNNEVESMNDEQGKQKTVTISVACPDSPIRCWNWDGFREGSEEQRQRSLYLGGKRRTKTVSLRGHHQTVLSLDLNYSCEWMLSSSLDKTILLWNVRTKKPIVKYLQPHPSWQVKFSKLGYVFGSVGLDRALCLWSTDRPDPARILVGHTDDVICLSFHHKIDFIATGSEDQTVRCWETRSAKQIRLLSGPKERVQCLSFSRDGNFLACGTGPDIWIYDLRTTKVLDRFTLHLDEVIKLGFTPYDDVLVSSSMDGTIKLWDVKSSSSSSSGSSGSSGSSANRNNRQVGSSNVKKMMKKKVLLTTYYTKNSPVYDFEYVSKRTIIGLGVKRNDINMFNI